MAIDFPNSPSVGELYTVEGITRRWNGVTWSIVPSTIQGVTGSRGIQGIQGSAVLSSAVPASLGIAAAGSSSLASRDDHVHSSSLSSPLLTSAEEVFNIVASAATGAISLDLLTSSAVYYTTNATANFTLNFRGNASNTLNSILSVGTSITAAFINTNGTTAYYPTAFSIDGTSVTPKWQNGTAPTAGNASSLDIYSFTIIKTAATPTYVVLGSQSRFA